MVSTREARFFNTAGPCRPELHYMLDPLRRLEGVQRLIDRQSYFVVHGPRQSGKTTALEALARHLTAEGTYTAVRLSVEVGRSYPDDPAAAQEAVLERWTSLLDKTLPESQRPRIGPGDRASIGSFLTAWAHGSDKPLVVFLDEIDALTNTTLLNVLSQLREGHGFRPRAFPSSIALIGMRDVRDYKIASGGSPYLDTSSPFNVTAASIVLREFTRDEVAELYAQHTADTGQVFTEDALDLAFYLSQGQPWLVNALAQEATDELVTDRSVAVRADDIDEARERLIARQGTHLDSLIARLQEPRVRAILEPMLAGTFPGPIPDNDLRYSIDLGLVRKSADGTPRIANPIYHEVIPRALATSPQESMATIAPSWLDASGRLDFAKLLDAFLAFWREQGEALIGGAAYTEIAPHLVLMAFLHRVSNGHGRIEREYAVGRGRLDLLLTYGQDRLALELKVWRPGESDPKDEGLEQLDGYLAGLGVQAGWLVIFDRREALPRLRERVSAETATTKSGRMVHVVRA